MRDLYTVLHVPPQASDAEIKSAFRTVAKTCHPDVRPGDQAAQEAFHAARQAYEYLSNPEVRRAYDDYLERQRTTQRQKRRRAVRTMSTTFLLTVMAVALAAFWWHGRLSVSHLVSAAVEHAGAHEVER